MAILLRNTEVIAIVIADDVLLELYSQVPIIVIRTIGQE